MLNIHYTLEEWCLSVRIHGIHFQRHITITCEMFALLPLSLSLLYYCNNNHNNHHHGIMFNLGFLPRTLTGLLLNSHTAKSNSVWQDRRRNFTVTRYICMVFDRFANTAEYRHRGQATKMYFIWILD